MAKQFSRLNSLWALCLAVTLRGCVGDRPPRLSNSPFPAPMIPSAIWLHDIANTTFDQRLMLQTMSGIVAQVPAPPLFSVLLVCLSLVLSLRGVNPIAGRCSDGCVCLCRHQQTSFYLIPHRTGLSDTYSYCQTALSGIVSMSLTYWGWSSNLQGI